MQNVYAVIDYCQEADEYTVLVTTEELKKVSAFEFAANYSSRRANAVYMTAEENAQADLFERYFDEDPTDLVGRFVLF